MSFTGLISFAILVSAFLPRQVEAQAEPVRFQTHDLYVGLQVPDHKAQIRDEGTVEIQKGWNYFHVNNAAVITHFSIAGKAAEVLTAQPADTVTLAAFFGDKPPATNAKTRAMYVFFKADSEGVVPFRITFTAEFSDPVQNVRFSNELVGKEVSGTILEQGAYLSPSVFFYPRGDEELSSFTVTITIPVEWESVSDGNRLASTVRNNRKIQTWRNPYQSNGVIVTAAPYSVKSIRVDGIEVACYFFADDTSLFSTYLPAAANYIRMYSDLIGPYPYQRFTVVENFFPTGYGMPAWTLLGREILRLPFIVYTSLGHEVLHNWWGNSVYVDYQRGNWCEAATVYGADYRYKLLRSAEAARNYRKDILKQYASYITENNDFPIRQFTARSSPDTRTIGYNKAMMVYHMIEEEIGTESFFEAWKRIYRQYKAIPISWEEWIAAFEETSGKALDDIIPQWIDQAGAPLISLEILNVNKSADSESKVVSFRLKENSGQQYRLQVPLRFSGASGAIDTVVTLRYRQQTYNLQIPVRYNALTVDPDYHLFRKLYPEEIEPIISGILGTEKKSFVSYATDEQTQSDFSLFAENLIGDSTSLVLPDDINRADPGIAPILLNPEELPGYLGKVIVPGPETIRIDSVEYPRRGHTFILTAQNWSGFNKLMVILTGDTRVLPRLGELIPHYGKYSYLVFKGTKNIAKGQWPVGASPLSKKI